MIEDRREAVRRAARVIRDLNGLRALMGVSMADLLAWLEGRGNPPLHAFLKAVDIIASHGSQLPHRRRST